MRAGQGHRHSHGSCPQSGQAALGAWLGVAGHALARQAAPHAPLSWAHGGVCLDPMRCAIGGCAAPCALHCAHAGMVRGWP